ncbi:hypothetical protein [Actinoplanes sp. NPDC026623]|uniref:hypothetical protein n=1 Tax=Actinoplanes sp. NPDC026623 TaxID=3155610 RepID=UPI00340A4BB9
MRHLRSIMYALVLAPAIWILCGVGFDQDLTGRARDNGGIESLSGVLLLLLAGAAYAILLFAPISPAGPTLAGLAFAGVGAWARLAPDSYASVWPANVAKDGFDVSTPGYGLAVLLAVPLLCTALSARRWRAYEPPEILLIGTIGRARGAARVAGTPMASETTSIIPQQRQPMRTPATDTTQLVVQADRTVIVPTGGEPHTTVLPVDDDGDEKTTVIRIGTQPEAPATVPTTAAAPTQADEATVVSAATLRGDDEPTEVSGAELRGDDEPTVVSRATLRGDDEPTEVSGAATGGDGSPAAGDEARDVAATDDTRDVLGARAAGDDVAANGAAPVGGPDDDATTRLVLPDPQGAGSGEMTQVLRLSAPPAESGEKTEVLRLPAATESGEKTEVIRVGTVDPPAERTQLLTFPAPDEATVVTPAGTRTEETTKAMSIAGTERPDPGADPTTPLNVPGEATTAASQDRRAMTVTNLERPADEADDDTRATAE